MKVLGAYGTGVIYLPGTVSPTHPPPVGDVDHSAQLMLPTVQRTLPIVPKVGHLAAAQVFATSADDIDLSRELVQPAEARTSSPARCVPRLSCALGHLATATTSSTCTGTPTACRTTNTASKNTGVSGRVGSRRIDTSGGGVPIATASLCVNTCSSSCGSSRR